MTISHTLIIITVYKNSKTVPDQRSGSLIKQKQQKKLKENRYRVGS